jgi:hypothetical protein
MWYAGIEAVLRNRYSTKHASSSLSPPQARQPMSACLPTPAYMQPGQLRLPELEADPISYLFTGRQGKTSYKLQFSTIVTSAMFIPTKFRTLLPFPLSTMLYKKRMLGRNMERAQNYWENQAGKKSATDGTACL